MTTSRFLTMPSADEFARDLFWFLGLLNVVLLADACLAEFLGLTMFPGIGGPKTHMLAEVRVIWAVTDYSAPMLLVATIAAKVFARWPLRWGLVLFFLLLLYRSLPRF